MNVVTAMAVFREHEHRSAELDRWGWQGNAAAQPLHALLLGVLMALGVAMGPTSASRVVFGTRRALSSAA